MKMKRRVIKILAWALALAVITTPAIVLADTWEYYTEITIKDTSGSDRTGVPVIIEIEGQNLVDAGYVNSGATDTRVLEGTAERDYLITTERITAFIPSLAAEQSRGYNLYTGYLPLITDSGSFGIIPGTGGYVTVSDDDTLELDDDFEIEQKGWVDTDATTVSFQAAGVVDEAATDNVTPALPVGWATDDIWLCLVASLDNVNSTLPGGWTAIDAGTNNGANLRTTLHWRRAEIGDTAPLVTHAAGSGISAVIIGYSGVTPDGSPFDVNQGVYVKTPASIVNNFGDGVTTNESNDIIVLLSGIGGQTTSITYTGTPTPTERVDAPDTAARPSLVIADFPLVTAGTTGARTSTITSFLNNGYQLSLIPIQKNLVYKEDAFRTYIDGATNITSEITPPITSSSYDPTADGTTNEGDIIGGLPTAWQTVIDDDDATLLRNAGDWQTDLFVNPAIFTDKVVLDVITSVEVYWRIQESQVQADSTRGSLYINGSQYDGTTQTPGLAWAWLSQEWTLNPDGATSWEVSDLENLEFGFGQRNTIGGHNVETSECYFVVNHRLVKEATALGIASGEHTVTTRADGTFMELLVDTENLLWNSDFEVGDPPTGWPTSRTVIAREETIIKVGTKSLKITCDDAGGTGSAYAYQLITDHTRYQGENVTLGAWVYAPSANDEVQRLGIWDGVAIHFSGDIPRDNNWHWMTVLGTIDAGASSVNNQFYVKVSTNADNDDILYVDGTIMVGGDTIPAEYISDPPVTVALAGASVDDNNNDWTINQNDTTPYMEYYKHTVSGVEHAWYESNYMVDGTTLIDRSCYALDFVATNTDFVEIPADQTQLNFTSGDFSIIARVKTDDLTANNYVFARGINNTDGYVVMINASGQLDFYTSQSGVNQRSRSDSDIVIATWYTVGISRIGTSAIPYINGLDAHSLVGSHTDPLTCARSAKIGIHDNKSAAPFDGKIEFLMVYERALDENEHLYIHNNSWPQSESGLALWLKVEEGVNTTASDSSTYGSDGTIDGAEWATGTAERLAGNSGTNDGEITWGSNTDLAVTIGSTTTFASTTPDVAGVGDVADTVTPAEEPSEWYASGTGISDLPFYETFYDAADDLGMTTQTLYTFVMLGVATAIGLSVLIFTGSALIAAVATGLTMGAGVSTTVLGGWMIYTFILFSLTILYLARQH